jgi:tRNA threonylcarbamoyladenosine biosynthesis protein TsaE
MAFEKTIEVRDLATTQQIGKSIGSKLKGGEVIELFSDLGGGKTTLVKSIALGAGSSELVSSPSFTICNEYKSKKLTIYHYDFFRLSDPGIIRRELAEVVDDPKAVIIVEWPEVIEEVLPTIKLSLTIENIGDTSRRFLISCSDQLNYLVSDS